MRPLFPAILEERKNKKNPENIDVSGFLRFVILISCRTGYPIFTGVQSYFVSYASHMSTILVLLKQLLV